jgi:hypothetical protein
MDFEPPFPIPILLFLAVNDQSHLPWLTKDFARVLLRKQTKASIISKSAKMF